MIGGTRVASFSSGQSPILKKHQNSFFPLKNIFIIINVRQILKSNIIINQQNENNKLHMFLRIETFGFFFKLSVNSCKDYILDINKTQRKLNITQLRTFKFLFLGHSYKNYFILFCYLTMKILCACNKTKNLK